RCPLLAETTAARLHALAGTTARGSGAGAGYQSGREHYRRGVAAFQAGQQEPGQRHGLVGGGGADGGQGRGGVGGGLDVAEAHDGQVVRDAEARFGGGAEGADGEVVGGGEGGVEAAVVGEQPGEGGRAGVGGVLGQGDVREEAGALEGVAVTGHPVLDGDQVGGAADEADPPAPLPQQILGGGRGSPGVVGVHVRHERGDGGPAEQDERHVGAGEPLGERVGAVGGEQHDPVGQPGFDVLNDAAAAFGGVGEHERDLLSRPFQDAGDVLHDGGGER